VLSARKKTPNRKIGSESAWDQSLSEKRLLDDDRFAGATIGRFLARVFLIGGHGACLYFDHAFTHLEYLGTDVHTDFARGAERIVDTNLHFVGPLKPKKERGLRSTSTNQPGGCFEVRALRIHKEVNLHQASFYESSTKATVVLKASPAVCGSAQGCRVRGLVWPASPPCQRPRGNRPQRAGGWREVSP
jgi:hypothetical protein